MLALHSLKSVDFVLIAAYGGFSIVNFSCIAQSIELAFVFEKLQGRTSQYNFMHHNFLVRYKCTGLRADCCFAQLF